MHFLSYCAKCRWNLCADSLVTEKGYYYRPLYIVSPEIYAHAL